MRPTGIVLRVIAVVAVLVGLLWIGQGLGYVRWPSSSFMIDQQPWAIYGVALAVLGVVLWLIGRRRR
jgi:hypothetical protein